MADAILPQLSPLDGLLTVGRHGASVPTPGTIFREHTGLALASVIARKDSVSALSNAARTSFALELPSSPRYVRGSDIDVVWTGHERWLALAPRKGHDDFDRVLRDAFGSFATISLQSDGWCVLSIAGPKARDVLAAGLAIDLHPRAFRPYDTAVTQVAHMGVQIWQLDDTPTYEIAVFRSFARSLWLWLAEAAAKHGYELAPPI